MIETVLQNIANLINTGRIDDAETALKQAKQKLPQHPQYELFMGAIAFEREQLPIAEKHFKKALKAFPGNIAAKNSLATVLAKQANYPRAEQLLREVIQQQPGYLAAEINLAALYLEQDKNEQAYSLLQELVGKNTNNPVLFNMLGISQRRLGKVAGAIASLNQALQLNPDFLDAHKNIAALFLNVDAAEKALDHLDIALSMCPDDTTLLKQLGQCHIKNGLLDKARDAIAKVLKYDPSDVEAMLMQARILDMAGQHAEAEILIERVLKLEPNNLQALQSRAFMSNYSEALRREDVYSRHHAFGEALSKLHPPVKNKAKKSSEPKDVVTVGFVSGDFNHHAVTYFFLPLARHYDRSRIKIVCYHNSEKVDDFTQKIKDLVDGYHNISGLATSACKSRFKQDGIDVLIDMSGLSGGNRLDLFAKKLVPIQLSWLAYPNTTGLDAIDYRVSEYCIEPLPDSQAYSTEKIVHMPNGFLCFESPVPREQLNIVRDLSPDSVRLGSCNNFRKLTRTHMSLWAQAMNRIDNATLTLKYAQLTNPSTCEEVLDFFASLGVSRDRIKLVGKVRDYKEHLEFYNNIDIALDTFPYNGTTTTFEALYMATPVMTMRGDRHAARVGAAILGKLELDELIANNAEEYVERIVALASSAERISELKQCVDVNLLESYLMDGASFSKDFADLIQSVAQ